MGDWAVDMMVTRSATLACELTAHKYYKLACAACARDRCIADGPGQGQLECGDMYSHS